MNIASTLRLHTSGDEFENVIAYFCYLSKKVIVIRYFIFLSLIALVCCHTTQDLSQVEKPNVIVFIGDDISWDDFGCYGNKDVETPNIDRLAKNGLMFHNFYLTASSCSPSRNSILTGRYPHNTGAPELHQTPPDYMVGFPELLREEGYYSVQAGKFHMGPYARRSFDVMYDDGKTFGDGGELQWVQSVRERPKDKPFFMWFAAIDAHRDWGPNEFSGTHKANDLTPPAYLSTDTATQSDLAKYYDEVYRFDHYIGQVVDELESQKVLDNTLIIIMADNGRPFPHSKTRVNDRGMKTPFIVHWPAVAMKNQRCTSLVSAIDIAPTILEISGITSPSAIQGNSFSKLIQDPRQEFRNYVFAEHNWHDYEAYERMVRDKNFMYIRNLRTNKPLMGPADAIGSPAHQALVKLKEQNSLSEQQAEIFILPRPEEELFDCNLDPGQFKNLAEAASHKDQLETLRHVLNEWTSVTGDNTPGELTPDWYTLEPGYIKTESHGVRGETPGSANDATRIQKKGPF